MPLPLTSPPSLEGKNRLSNDQQMVTPVFLAMRNAREPSETSKEYVLIVFMTYVCCFFYQADLFPLYDAKGHLRSVCGDFEGSPTCTFMVD